jgi:hypothetical protein
MNAEPSEMLVGTEKISVDELSMVAAEHLTPIQSDIAPPNLILLTIPGLNLT